MSVRACCGLTGVEEAASGGREEEHFGGQHFAGAHAQRQVPKVGKGEKKGGKGNA